MKKELTAEEINNINKKIDEIKEILKNEEEDEE